MSFRGGKFSTGTTGNFQPELTQRSGIHHQDEAYGAQKARFAVPPVRDRNGGGVT